MKGSYLAVPLTICTYVFLATGIEDPHCFYLTWPGFGKTNCTNVKKKNSRVPCIEELCISDTKPDMTALWKFINDTKNYTYVRPMESGNVCIRYTYMYNGAVMNISYFPGKVIEDQTTPVTSGCYVQYTEGYSIEVCACKSESKSMPCNSTIRNMYSTLITFAAAAVSLFAYKIFIIP